jgi:hypothetical protein
MSTDPIAQLVRRVEELERRLRRTIVRGVVTDVDHKKGLVRVDDGLGTEDGDPNITDWLPWAEHAGKIKTRTMPSKGQGVTILAPSGAYEDAIVMKGWFNENNKMPKADKGEHVFINGTRYKKVIKNGPEDQGQSGDGSDSTAGQQASPAQDEKRNQNASGVEEIRLGKLGDDEGSWGDGGQNQVRPQGDDKHVVEHAKDENTHTDWATDGDQHHSKITQQAPVINHNVDDKATRDHTGQHIVNTVLDDSNKSVHTVLAANINATVNDSKQVDINPERVNTVGKTTLNNGDRRVVFVGSIDSGGDLNAQGSTDNGGVWVPT